MSLVYNGRRRGSHDALCCCEYVDKDGRDSHILACCCDCEALDSVCDRYLKCEKLDKERVDDCFKTIEDRLRIPGFSGKGAMKIQLDVALPMVVVPLGLSLATINTYFTVFVLFTLPSTILGFYQIWLKRSAKERTKIFYSWGVTSVCFMYFIFEFVIVGYREILLWENLSLSTLFGLTLYAFYRCKKSGPGVVQKSGSQDFRQKQEEAFAKLQEEDAEMTDPIGNLLIKNFGMDKKQLLEKTEDEKEEARGHIISAQSVNWVDSRTIDDGRVKTWCRWCRVNKPPRAGHCPICNVCVPGRDHHCVWIDQCVGANNHRAFFIAILLVLATGSYGVHLTLTTICTPIMVLDWFLIPNDCRFAYTDFFTAISFVSACYTIVCLIIMAATCLTQCVLISQNVTSHEFHNAGLRKWVQYGICARNNVNNKGFVMNWINFWSGRRRQNPKYKTVSL